MATRRMLSKTASTSRKLMKVSDFAALLWTWTIPHCDDLGHMDGSPEMLKGIVIPLRSKTTDEVATALSELEGSELIKTYEVAGEKYLEIVKWEEYQTFKNDRELQQEFPLAPWNPEVSNRNPDGKIVRLREEKGIKEKEREGIDTSVSTDSFSLFWEKYPKKELKKKTHEIWKRKNMDSKLQDILSFLDKAILTDRWQKGFIKQPPAFLNGECWTDDLKEYNDRNNRQILTKTKF